MHEAVFRHGIEYPDNHGITPSDIAATLIAHEKLAPIVADVLEAAYPGLKSDKIRINLALAGAGSLSEAFFVAILASYQPQLNEILPIMIESMTGVPVPDHLKPIISVLFVVLLFYGLYTIGWPKGKEGRSPADDPR